MPIFSIKTSIIRLVDNVTNMEGMFADAQKFNQNISAWNVSSVISFDLMFHNTNHSC